MGFVLKGLQLDGTDGTTEQTKETVGNHSASAVPSSVPVDGTDGTARPRVWALLAHPWWPDDVSLARRELLTMPARWLHPRFGVEWSIALHLTHASGLVIITTVASVRAAAARSGTPCIGPTEVEAICAHGEQRTLVAVWDELLDRKRTQPTAALKPPSTVEPALVWWAGAEGRFPPHTMPHGWTLARLLVQCDLELERVEVFA